MEGKPEVLIPATPKELLEDAVVQTNRLDKEVTLALRTKREVATYRDKLRARATIVAELPARLGQLVEQGEEIPEEELANLESLALIAREALDKTGDFYLGSILDLKGSKIGEPNELEKIVNRLYPPKSS